MRALSAVIPFLEMGLGALLLTGIAPRVAGAAALFILAAFTVALLVPVLQRRTVHCNCFGEASMDTPVTWASVARNLALLVAGGWMVVQPASSTVDSSQPLTVILSGAIVALLTRVSLTAYTVHRKLRALQAPSRATSKAVSQVGARGALS